MRLPNLQQQQQPPARDAGFTLVEVVMGLSFLIFSVAVVAVGINTGTSIGREIRDFELVQTQAQAYIDSMLAQPFGTQFDPFPTAAQIDEIFDNDSIPGDVTMFQLRDGAQGGNHTFELAEFPVAGVWRVQIDNDIDGDGAINGILETGDKIFRLQVFFNERPVLRTFRATDVTS